MTKPGYKTTEFHVTLLTIVGSFVMSKTSISEDCQKEVVAQLAPYAVSAIAAASYAISRSITKLRGTPAAPPPAPATAPAPTKPLVETTGQTDVIDLTSKGNT